jgi:hypothetical protein
MLARIVAIALIATPLLAQPRPWDASLRRAAELLEESYVDADAAKKCAAHLRARLDTGAFAAATPAAFAALVTNELRSACADKHLELALRAAPAAGDDPNGWMADLRERNYDFVRAERMAGNVGYLQVNSFPPPELAGATAEAAMAWLANSDAVIIDLRWNSGGAGTMVTLLASYFFAEPTLLTTTYRRASNRTTENWTLPRVAGARMPKVPLFILTSSATFSAAEAFAAPLQALKRATIVGEQTKGGANPGRNRRVDDLFDLFVPVGATRLTNDTTWEGAGITPDVRVPAREALITAHRAAVARAAAETTDATRRKELGWISELLAGEPRISAAELQRWAGRYGDREIIFTEGALFSSVDRGPRRRLHPLSASTFLVESAEQVRFRFEPSRLVIELSSGREESVLKSVQ